MVVGKTERETLQLNGWGIGDVLEGDEGYGPDRIIITAIGEEAFICRWDYGAKGKYGKENGNTTLICRDWKKIEEQLQAEAKGGLIGTKPQTHIVLKLEDVERLSPVEQETLSRLTMKIGVIRSSKGKAADAQYYVVNTDEPYAPYVQGAIENGEFQKKMAARRARQ